MEAKLIELLKLCIEKGLAFTYSQSQQITVYKYNAETEQNDFHQFVGVYDFWEEKDRMNSINALIEKVKNYNNDNNGN